VVRERPTARADKHSRAPGVQSGGVQFEEGDRSNDVGTGSGASDQPDGGPCASVPLAANHLTDRTTCTVCASGRLAVPEP